MTGKQKGLRFGQLGNGAIHLCVDMQRMFDSGSPWQTVWLRKVLPQVVRICEAHPERTIFSKFIPALSSDEAPGAWRRYFRAWEHMTLRNMDRSLLDLVPELQTFVPPAVILEKRTYSPWAGTDLLQSLLSRKIDTVVISGGRRTYVYLPLFSALSTPAFAPSSRQTPCAVRLMIHTTQSSPSITSVFESRSKPLRLRRS